MGRHGLWWEYVFNDTQAPSAPSEKAMLLTPQGLVLGGDIMHILKSDRGGGTMVTRKDIPVRKHQGRAAPGSKGMRLK